MTVSDEPAGDRASSGPPRRERAADRFARSMQLDFERWHDGVGYDLGALRDAGPDERAAIEAMLLAHSPRGWRDVEALAALDIAQRPFVLRFNTADRGERDAAFAELCRRVGVQPPVSGASTALSVLDNGSRSA